MSNYRKICPACGSASVAYTNQSMFQFPVDRRCDDCGTVWRMAQGITESIVTMLFGAALALGVSYVLLSAAGMFLSGRFGVIDLLTALFAITLVLSGLSAVIKGAASLRQPRNAFRILRRGDLPRDPAEPPDDRS